MKHNQYQKHDAPSAALKQRFWEALVFWMFGKPPRHSWCGFLEASRHNLIWILVITLSIIGAFLLVKIAYANPLGLPEYAFTKPGIKEAYAFAKISPDKLEGLPCNCGCMIDADNHGGRLHKRGLIDCFMQGDVNVEGIWDSHASECGLCYEDALLAQQEYEKGKTKDEIKEVLMAKYAAQTFSDTAVYGRKI